MNRNYPRPTIPEGWAESRNTHIAVATAIHAISDKTRSPEAIWEDPTLAEWGHVAMAIEEYVTHGDFPSERNGLFQWGEEVIRGNAPLYKVYANGTFWGSYRADRAEDAIQMAADEHGTVDIGQDRAKTDGMTAEFDDGQDEEQTHETDQDEPL